MKKLTVFAVAIALAGIALSAWADDLEISGHINTGMGWQYRTKTIHNALFGGFTEEGMLPANAEVDTDNRLTHRSDVLFYVGDVELDLAKTFGENIRLRADLDFVRANSYGYFGWGVNDIIEQAYVTLNIPVGNGMEFLVGRFNAPMGLEAVDTNDNDLPFHTVVFNYLRPKNLTGAKLYYAFSDMVDLHLWLANNLQDVISTGGNGPKQIPAFGMRLGVKWGEKEKESTVGLSAAASAEADDNDAEKMGEWSYLADVDANVWLTDAFALGLEGLFRVDDATSGAKDNYYYAGILNLHYVFSDVWDGTLRYTWAYDRNGDVDGLLPYGTGGASINGADDASQYHVIMWSDTTGTSHPTSALGAKVQDHQIDLGINYHITDGAKLSLMDRFEYVIPAKGGVARSYGNLNKTGIVNTLALNFAYEF